ncbi:MAG: DUF1934 domain-containing protein [Ruminococcus sp.]|nr:DUF1934 domain-containing protein [Ruminococcus sp.]MBP3797635.1 DUF1934 domain-containing protein [Ruminococcus sp.]MBQ1432207.1 DUF1934 domain-containing protein [Ruminococcus sp.]
MEAKDVDIKLISRQFDGETTEETEVLSQGRFGVTDEGYFIEYEESEATGYEGSTTRLENFGTDKVTMSRSGSVTSNMTVQLGEKHHCVYGTLFGNFEVGVAAKKINVKLDDNGGTLYFSYVVDVNSSYIGDFEISVEVKPRA